MESELKLWRTKISSPAFQEKVGSPLDVEINPNHYGAWPSLRRDLPALAFCASVILCGLASAVVNEEFHSVAGIVNSKLRASIKPENLEFYALARVLEQRRVKNAAPDAVLAGYVDLDSVMDQLEPAEDEGAVADADDAIVVE